MPSIASTALAATPIAAAPTNPDPAAAIAAGRAPTSPRSRTRPPHRCGHAARRDGARLRRLRCGRRMGLEDRLRLLRGGDGSVPAQIRPGYVRQGRITCRHAADAGQDRRASPDAYAPLRGEPGAPAILDADHARSRGQHRRRDHAGRPGAGAIGRDGPARHPRRAGRRRARAQRAGGYPCRSAGPPLSGHPRHPVRRGADR